MRKKLDAKEDFFHYYFYKLAHSRVPYEKSNIFPSNRKL